LKTIIITGSTRGIGRGLAENFLNMGHQVVISGRTTTSVNQALESLANASPGGRLLGVPCDVSDFSQLEQLWQTASQHFGKIDIWINNAGIAQPQMPFWELTESQITELVKINVTGAMFGARVALAGFLAQGEGALYNMEGLGSDGRKVEGLTLYGSSKRALQYLTDSLTDEVKGTGVLVGAIRPGMVMTDLILKQYQGRDPSEWESARKIFNILADRLEVVTPFLAKRIIRNQKNGAMISWLSQGKVIWRFLTAGIKKRDVFEGIV